MIVKMKLFYRNLPGKVQNLLVIVLLGASILLSYINTFDAGWHLDDRPNILDNRAIHIHSLDPETLLRTFFSPPTQDGVSGERLYRPLPCLSFALNWYFGQDKVFGYHVVNLLIHFLSACFLYLCIQNILRTPNLANKFQGEELFIATLSTALWALNPVQTQAVTYIVQRMASMAALFYIISIYLYLKCRQNHSFWQRILLLCGCMVGFLFGLGSKENAATLPLAILLIEVICFQDLSVPRIRKRLFWGSIAGGVLLVLFSALVLVPGGMFSFLQGYEGRPFTLGQRVLTQPRIVLFYLSQLFYAVPHRLSIEHDIMVSTSLLHPWTTLPAIILIDLLIGLGISQIRKRPLIALSVLFFFLNHTIESSIIPLELMFEHRNYLPSMFLFVPVAAGFKRLIEHYQATGTAMRPLLQCFLVLLVAALAWGTFIRNMAWKTEKTLWEDALQKAPNSHRPYHNLAQAYYMKIGHYEAAIQLYEKSLQLRISSKHKKALTLSNLALLYLQKNDNDKAVKLWKDALAIAPNIQVVRHRYAIGLIEMKKWSESLIHIDQLINRHPNNSGYNYLKGYVLLNQRRYPKALSFFNRCLATNSRSGQALLGVGICHYFLDQYKKAEMNFLQALKTGREKELTLLWLVEINMKTDDFMDTDLYLAKLYEIISYEDLINLLQSNQQKDFLPSESKKSLIKKIHRFYDKNKNY
jgi:tetratricopeptide (TPR) repeat protein